GRRMAAPAGHGRAGARRPVAPHRLHPHEPADRLRGDGHRRPARRLARLPGGAFPRGGGAGGAGAGGLPGVHALPHPGFVGAGLLRQRAAAVHLPAGPARVGTPRANRAGAGDQRRRAGLRGGGAAARRLAPARVRAPRAAQHRLHPDPLLESGLSFLGLGVQPPV
ncbi:MAG: ABC transporter, permease protein 2 (cluster 5, nickel/peptides/opines), partial [uncultured Acetobacteraceae bacterium]